MRQALECVQGMVVVNCLPYTMSTASLCLYLRLALEALGLALCHSIPFHSHPDVGLVQGF